MRTTVRTTASLAAGMLLGATLLAGCGSSGDKSDDKAASGGGYCALLKSASKEISSFTGSTVPDDAALASFEAQVKALAAKAPDAVKADWKTVSEGLTTLTDALDESGVKLKDLAGAMATGKLPDGVTMAQLQALGQKVQALTSADFEKATAAIDKNAKADCDVTLDLNGS